MTTFSPTEMGRQLRKPEGEAGINVALLMNKSNAAMYAQALELLPAKPNQNMLEIGFGNGAHFADLFARQPSLQLYGLDFSETMVTEAEKNHKSLIETGQLKLTCANAAEMPYAPCFFDAVLTLNTLYFWTDAAQQLQEIARVLKPGGHFLLGFRPKEAIENAPFTKEVFRLYTAAEVESLATKAGFEKLISAENQVTVQAPDGTPHELKGISLLLRKPAK